MKPGRAWRIPNFDEMGMPTVVEVSPEVAARVWFLEFRYYGEGPDERRCAAFYDDATGEVYAQPCQGVSHAGCRAMGVELHLVEVRSR